MRKGNTLLQKKLQTLAGIGLRILVDIVVLQYIFAKPNRSATAEMILNKVDKVDKVDKVIQAAPGNGGDVVFLPQSGQ